MVEKIVQIVTQTGSGNEPLLPLDRPKPTPLSLHRIRCSLRHSDGCELPLLTGIEMKITVKGNLYVKPSQYDGDPAQFMFFMCDSKDYWIESGYVPICEHIIEVDAPEVDIVAGQIQCLLAKRNKLTGEYTKATAKIDDTLAQLKCLTFDDSGVAA